MSNTIEIILTTSPTFFTIARAALKSKGTKYNPQEPLPDITLIRNEIQPDIKRLEKFARICGIAEAKHLPLVYPLTFIYPVVQVLLARREIPFLLTKVLNTRMQIIQHRHIDVTESFNVRCRLAAHRVLEKGVELDIDCTVQIRGRIAWECKITFYCRGRFGAPAQNNQSPVLEPIPEAPETARWYLPAGSGISFARLCGDWNPLHYWTWYAKLMGFKRAFAQPLLVLAETLCRLETKHPAGNFLLDIAFKGPVYYKSDVILKSVENTGSERFDIYCEDNPRPCISGRLKFEQ